MAERDTQANGTKTPELLVDFITSLDGYGAAEGWPGWWGLQGPEYLAWLGEQPEAGYTVLMGANTYRLMSGFAAEGEPGTDALAGMSKIVFSRTLAEPLTWANTQLVPRDAVQVVRELKAKQDASSMRTMGSLTLCRSLLNAGLVDRFRVVVFPVITGSTGSDRIYDGYPDVALDMLNSRTFDGRIQLLEYVPRVLAGPPGTDNLADDRQGQVGTCEKRRIVSAGPRSERGGTIAWAAVPLAPHARLGFGRPRRFRERYG